MAKLTQQQWDEMRAEYCATKISYRELAEKYGTSKTSVVKRASKEKWQKVAQKVDQKLTEKLSDKIAEQRVKVTEKHIRISNKLSDVIEQILAAEGFTDDKFATSKAKQLVDALLNLQKVERTALNMDEVKIEHEEPKISYIKGLDIDKI